MQPSRTRVVLAFAAVYLCWGSTYLAIRYAVETLPPFLMAGTRYIIAGLPMYLWLRRRGGPRPTFAHWRSALILGAFMMFGGNGLVSWAEQHVPSSIAAVMIATLPLWMTLLDRFFFNGPSLHGGTMLGLLLGFGGVAWLMAPSGNELARINPIGGGILMLAAFLWSIGSLLSRRVPRPSSPLVSVAMQMFMGGLVLIFAGTVTGEWGRVELAQITTRSMLALLYLAVIGSMVATTAYIWLLTVRSAAAVSTYAFVNPVIAVVLGWSVGGEYLTPRMMAAATVIVVAVAIILGVAHAHRAKPAVPASPAVEPVE